jgi:hypothetical protein
MVNRFGHYKKEHTTHTIGDAKFSSSSVGDGYTLVGLLEGYAPTEQFQLIEKKTPSRSLQIGRGLCEVYLLDSKDNAICLEGNKKQIEKLFLTNENTTQEKNIMKELPEQTIDEEPTIISGPQGQHGYAGADGTDGTDGIDGKDGADGTAGVDGVDGKDGADGTDGVDGKDGDVGLKGEKGDSGSKGEQGLHGDVGPQGTQGTQGDQGIQGTQGDKGDQGIQGLQGEVGSDAEQGDQGIQGDTGTQGIQGIQGTQGTQGDKGDQGIQGIQGIRGERGDRGEDGKSPIVAAGSPLLYDEKKNTIKIDPNWINQIPVGQVGGAVIGGGGSNTGVRKDGTLLHPAPTNINFIGDNITAVKNKQNIDVTFVDPQAGITQITIASQADSGATTAHELGLTNGVLQLRANNPLTLSSFKSGNKVQWTLGINKMSSSIGAWQTSESNYVATEGQLAILRDGSHLITNDINTSGKSILAATMDGGTF